MGTGQKYGSLFLEDLSILRNFTSKRLSSWDRSGKNYDWVSVPPQKAETIAEINGPGCIKHFYVTALSFNPFYYRKAVIRMYWDEEVNPSVEVPLGDFFGIGNCLPRYFTSLLLAVNPGDPDTGTQGLNSYFPMPFRKSARIELVNESEIPLDRVWYHIDYQLYDELDEVAYFHAQFRRECLTLAKGNAAKQKNVMLWEGINDTGEDNYVLLEAEGNGQLAGIFLSVDNIAGGWWGEGDDMIFIDGEKWPPSLHGTGTEEIFGGGACPKDEYAGPYAGFPLINNRNFYRKTSMYRFYVPDPIRFRKSIKVTIEHGHANNFENDYSSVAYWYQEEPHRTFPPFPSATERLPFLLPEEKQVADKQMEICEVFYRKVGARRDELQYGFLRDVSRGYILPKLRNAQEMFFEGKYDFAMMGLEELERFITKL